MTFARVGFEIGERSICSLTLGILASNSLTIGNTGDLWLTLVGTFGVLLLTLGVVLELSRGSGVLEGLFHFADMRKFGVGDYW